MWDTCVCYSCHGSKSEDASSIELAVDSKSHGAPGKVRTQVMENANQLYVIKVPPPFLLLDWIHQIGSHSELAVRRSKSSFVDGSWEVELV